MYSHQTSPLRNIIPNQNTNIQQWKRTQGIFLLNDSVWSWRNAEADVPHCEDSFYFILYVLRCYFFPKISGLQQEEILMTISCKIQYLPGCLILLWAVLINKQKKKITLRLNLSLWKYHQLFLILPFLIKQTNLLDENHMKTWRWLIMFHITSLMPSLILFRLNILSYFN